MYNYHDGRCGVISPDGKFGCTQMVGHQKEGNIFCSNIINGVTKKWCGYCNLFDTYNCRHSTPKKKMVRIINYDTLPYFIWESYAKKTV